MSVRPASGFDRGRVLGKRVPYCFAVKKVFFSLFYFRKYYVYFILIEAIISSTTIFSNTGPQPFS